jgi:hypothetical protein
MFEDIVYPNSIDVLLLLLKVECPKAFYRVILKTTTELVPIGHVQSTKTLFVVHVELALVVKPAYLAQIKALVRGLLSHLALTLIMEDPKAVE